MRLFDNVDYSPLINSFWYDTIPLDRLEKRIKNKKKKKRKDSRNLVFYKQNYRFQYEHGKTDHGNIKRIFFVGSLEQKQIQMNWFFLLLYLILFVDARVSDFPKQIDAYIECIQQF